LIVRQYLSQLGYSVPSPPPVDGVSEAVGSPPSRSSSWLGGNRTLSSSPPQGQIAVPASVPTPAVPFSEHAQVTEASKDGVAIVQFQGAAEPAADADRAPQLAASFQPPSATSASQPLATAESQYSETSKTKGDVAAHLGGVVSACSLAHVTCCSGAVGDPWMSWQARRMQKPLRPL
jgi:hypothetical protein